MVTLAHDPGRPWRRPDSYRPPCGFLPPGLGPADTAWLPLGYTWPRRLIDRADLAHRTGAVPSSPARS
jgi:hypothetical protein